MIVGIQGGLSVDHLVLEPVGVRFSCLGGPGLYAALGAALVAGTRVRLSCAMPECDGRFADVLASAGVDTSFARAVEDIPRVWILNSGRGRRIVALQPAEIELGESASDPDENVAPPQPDFYAGLAGLLASSPIVRQAVPPSVLVGVDPHQALLARDGLGYLEAVCTSHGVLLPSRVQLRLTDPDPRAAARHWASRFQIPVIARLDAEGMYVCTEDNGAWTVTDPNAHVVETTGAGDSSAGAIVAALAAGADPVDAAAFGVSVARLAISGWGHDALAEATPLRRPLAGVTTRKESQ